MCDGVFHPATDVIPQALYQKGGEGEMDCFKSTVRSPVSHEAPHPLSWHSMQGPMESTVGQWLEHCFHNHKIGF